MPLSLPRSYVDDMVAHARQESPNECAGIIAGQGGEARKLFRAENSEHSPYRYNIDSRDLLRIYRELEAHDWDILVIYHSHTHTPAYPSPTDLSLAAYPDAFYVLVSLASEPPDVRAYHIRDGAVTEEPIALVG